MWSKTGLRECLFFVALINSMTKKKLEEQRVNYIQVIVHYQGNPRQEFWQELKAVETIEKHCSLACSAYFLI